MNADSEGDGKGEQGIDIGVRENDVDVDGDRYTLRDSKAPAVFRNVSSVLPNWMAVHDNFHDHLSVDVPPLRVGSNRGDKTPCRHHEPAVSYRCSVRIVRYVCIRKVREVQCACEEYRSGADDQVAQSYVATVKQDVVPVYDRMFTAHTFYRHTAGWCTYNRLTLRHS